MGRIFQYHKPASKLTNRQKNQVRIIVNTHFF